MIRIAALWSACSGRSSKRKITRIAHACSNNSLNTTSGGDSGWLRGSKHSQRIRLSRNLVADSARNSDGLGIEPESWCPGAGSNHRHCDFQSHALPTELPGHTREPKGLSE